MAGIVQVTKSGPKTFTPAENITGGQVVEARAAGRIGVAAEGSLRVLGVALTDAQSPESVVTTTTTVNGRPVLNAAILPTNVGVAYGGIEVPVTYDVAAAFGDDLVATTAGRVRPYRFTDPDGAGPLVADTNPALIIGRCTAPAGVAAGAVGLMRTA